MLPPPGEVFVIIYDSDKGTLNEWLVGGLEVEEPGLATYAGPEGEGVAGPAIGTRVRGVEGYFGVREKDGEPKGWEWYSGTREVANFLGIEMNMDEVSEAIRAELNEILESLESR